MARESAVDPDSGLRRIAVILQKIVDRGRSMTHDERNDECGCGRCCAMLVRGLAAHFEGVMTL